MYQFETSSTNDSNSATIVGVQYRSYAASMAARNAFVRAINQRSSGRPFAAASR
jgi:hypothetical protein